MAKNQLEELKQARERIKSLEDQIKDLSQSLKEAEVLNQILLETFPDAVTMSDLEGNIIQVSKKTLELHGLQSADEVIGKRIQTDHISKIMVSLSQTKEPHILDSINILCRPVCFERN